MGVGVLLMVAIGLQFTRLSDAKEGDRSTKVQPVKLAERLPVNLGGSWVGRDELLGPNEVTRNAVERTLNYDDYVFRIFGRGDRHIGVYIAYWAPGRMPLQKVASHTPDRCWTENGWSCSQMRHREEVASTTVKLMDAQWRLFHPPAQPSVDEYVIYWHLVGTKLYDYGDRFNARPDFLKWWRDTVDYATSGSEAQYFFRVTSNRPFTELTDDPGWEELLGALAKLGLAEAPVAPAKG